MKAIILAAGEGTRLRPLTLDKPKCMVELNGISLLEYQIKILKSCGITDIVVIKGYKSECINFQEIKYYENENYDVTNMIRTLFCAEKELNDDVIISYGDILYESQVLKKLLNSNYDFSVIIDKQWKKLWELRFENPLDDAETLKLNKKNEIIEIGQKPKSYDEIEGQYIGLMKFSNKAVDIIKKSYHNAEKQNKLNLKIWNQNKNLDKAYMTDLLQGLIYEGNILNPIFINSGWLEIDSYEEYLMYKNKIKDNTLAEFLKWE